MTKEQLQDRKLETLIKLVEAIDNFGKLWTPVGDPDVEQVILVNVGIKVMLEKHPENLIGILAVLHQMLKTSMENIIGDIQNK